jgi:ribonuclease-3
LPQIEEKRILQEQTESLWDDLERRIGYHFRDRTLLAAALTHRSFANESHAAPIPDNERLEFLGDAVLDLVVGHVLFVTHETAAEGELSRLRAELVSSACLARLARALALGDCLRLGRGEARSGGRDKESLLADTLEAVIGAVFIDAGYTAAAAVIGDIFKPCLLDLATLPGQDYKTRLQELLQARQCPLPVYVLVATHGPDHQRRYQVDVLVAGISTGRGEGPTKKRAEQAAARQALESFSAQTGADDD